MDSRKNGRIKKYGVCLNDKCEKYKVIQEIVHGDLECSECKKKLSPCAPPRKRNNSKPIFWGIICLIILGAILGGIIFFSDHSENPVVTNPSDSIVIDTTKTKSTSHKADTILVRDTIVKHDTIVKNTPTTVIVKKNNNNDKNPPTRIQQKTTLKSGAKDFGFAVFKGTWPNDTHGRMIFKTPHNIDSRDPKGRVADAGDYVIGEWSEGHLIQGIWYGADNQVKGSIIIGK